MTSVADTQDQLSSAEATEAAADVVLSFGAAMLRAGNPASRTRTWIEVLARKVGFDAMSVGLSLDGIVALGDGLLISSWEASAVYRGKPGGAFEVVLPEQKSPADIGYDTKRGRVLVPHFLENTVEAYALK